MRWFVLFAVTPKWSFHFKSKDRTIRHRMSFLQTKIAPQIAFGKKLHLLLSGHWLSTLRREMLLTLTKATDDWSRDATGTFKKSFFV